jgi:K+-transporting ATPase ATPase A chain
LLQPVQDASGQTVSQQTIAVGPAASQIAIKQLGTNGGGFFNVNSAHPFENPTPLSNFLEMLAILLIPAALCYTFGKMVKDTKQGWALLTAMTFIFVVMLSIAVWSEQSGNPVFTRLGVDQTASAVQPGGNMEGKELRFGITNSALWATATTAASNGSVNAMHDSFTAIGGLVPMWMMQLGEVVYGGVGSGLYGMLAFVIVAVFIAGLMIGRTPEYLGKKIESYEMKMASLMVLIPVVCVLLGTAIAVLVPWVNLLWRIRVPTGLVRYSMLFHRQVIITAAPLPVWHEQPVLQYCAGPSNAARSLLVDDTGAGNCRCFSP